MGLQRRDDLSVGPLGGANAEASGRGGGAGPAMLKRDESRGAPAPSEAAGAEAAVPAPAKRSRKRVVLLSILGVVLMVGGYFGFGWWTEGRFFVVTDDAYVGADVTILEVDIERMRFLDITMHTAHTFYSSEAHILELLPTNQILNISVLDQS